MRWETHNKVETLLCFRDLFYAGKTRVVNISYLKEGWKYSPMMINNSDQILTFEFVRNVLNMGRYDIGFSLH